MQLFHASVADLKKAWNPHCLAITNSDRKEENTKSRGPKTNKSIVLHILNEIL